jgi:single-stranded DNA-binding protein
LKKGDAVAALGRLVERRWTPEQGDRAGDEQVRPELIAEVLGASLQFATVTIAKVAPSGERSERPLPGDD